MDAKKKKWGDKVLKGETNGQTAALQFMGLVTQADGITVWALGSYVHDDVLTASLPEGQV